MFLSKKSDEVIFAIFANFNLDFGTLGIGIVQIGLAFLELGYMQILVNLAVLFL